MRFELNSASAFALPKATPARRCVLFSFGINAMTQTTNSNRVSPAILQRNGNRGSPAARRANSFDDALIHVRHVDVAAHGHAANLAEDGLLQRGGISGAASSRYLRAGTAPARFSSAMSSPFANHTHPGKAN
jgi:hypothetical protein